MMTKRSSGIALSDYTLSLILAGIVIVPAIPFVTQAIQTAIVQMTATQATNAGMLQLKPLGVLSGKTQAANNNTPSPASPGGNGNNNNNAANTNTVTLTLSNGQKITITNYPSNPSQLIETVGVNGYTTLLADSLKQLAQQLLAAKVITSDTANTLINMANKGYEIGDIESSIENSASNYSGTLSNFSNAQADYHGAPMDNSTLANQIDGNSIDPLPGETTGYYDPTQLANYTPANAGDNLLSGFIQLYQQAGQDGSLADPAVSSLVGALVYQISRTADATANMVLGVTTQTDISQLKTYVASSSTNSNSANLCAAGNGNTNGTTCSP